MIMRHTCSFTTSSAFLIIFLFLLFIITNIPLDKIKGGYSWEYPSRSFACEAFYIFRLGDIMGYMHRRTHTHTYIYIWFPIDPEKGKGGICEGRYVFVLFGRRV